jgi:threonyl-tRNA synthetase
LLGLLRTRAFEQDDAHVLCHTADVQNEVARFIALLSRVYADLGFPDHAVALSTRPAVRAGTDAVWDWAEARLGDAARQCGIAYSVLPGEGAFYGPKLEFALRDRHGRSWQCGTIQLDCVLPGRLGASYVGPDGARAVLLVIHHAVFGSLGRFIAVLLEHHGGALPFWLAPEQVAVAPIAHDQDGFAGELLDAFGQAGVRAVLCDADETLSRRIVAARAAEVPVMAIAGPREAQGRTVTLRERNGAQSTLPISEAAAALAARR